MSIRRRLLRGASALSLATLVVAAIPSASVSPAHAAVTLNGAGSTWSQIAVDQWRADVARQGININYQGTGSTSGRVFYYSDQVDFAVSEIPFQAANPDATGTVVVNEIAKASKRPYVYLPVVAGGTSIMYHLKINGKLVRNLNLTPDTIAKIFTGVIRTWNDPAIKASNPTINLPAIPVRPVVRSDGSGTTAQMTAYFANQTPGVWNAFCAKVGIATPCPATSLYPEFAGSVAQPLSDGVANFVSASYNNGALTYVEYGYAKQRGFPVASVQNRSGAFTQPSAVNVAIALQGARFNSDNTADLRNVYTFADPSSYPISSYSYLIAPRTTAAPFSTAKGELLSRFITYFVCAGQQKAEQLGYSPLPRNLVENAFAAMSQIPGANPAPAINASSCTNPTLSQAWPPKATAPPTTIPSTATTQPGSPVTGSGATTTTQPGDKGNPNTGSTPGGTTNGTTPSGEPVFDQDGNLVTDGPEQGGGTDGGTPVAAGPVSVPDGDDPVSPWVVLTAVVCLLGLIIMPPMFVARGTRRTAIEQA